MSLIELREGLKQLVAEKLRRDEERERAGVALGPGSRYDCLMPTPTADGESFHKAPLPSTYAAIWIAELLSAADAVPTGSAVWQERCYGQWTNARLQLTPSQPDDGWCATALQRLAPQLTATCCRPEDGPLCGESGGIPGACDVDCAGLWAPYASQCRVEAAFYGQPELSAFFVGEVRALAAVFF